jgi:hypothetical protein
MKEFEMEMWWAGIFAIGKGMNKRIQELADVC